jgi:hypothetical protein
MDVDIDNRHAADSTRPRGRGGDCGIVKETKAHCAVAFCVVSRRPDECENGFAAGERFVYGLDGRAGGEQRDRFRVTRGESVGVENDGAAGRSLNRRYMLRTVRAEEFVLGRWTGRDNSAALLHPVRRHCIEHVCALGALRMTRRGNMILKTRGRN